MRRGALRHRLELYRPDTYDAGNEVETWKLWATPYSSIRVLEVTESAGNDYQGVEVVEFTLAYSRDIEFDYVDLIIVHRGREYDVLGVKNVDYLDRELRITAKRFDQGKRIVNG